MQANRFFLLDPISIYRQSIPIEQVTMPDANVFMHYFYNYDVSNYCISLTDQVLIMKCVKSCIGIASDVPLIIIIYNGLPIY